MWSILPLVVALIMCGMNRSYMFEADILEVFDRPSAPCHAIVVKFSDADFSGLWRKVVTRHARTLKEIKLHSKCELEI
jgi:hypothetical protein